MKFKLHIAGDPSILAIPGNGEKYNFLFEKMKDEDVIYYDTSQRSQWQNWNSLFGNTPPPNFAIVNEISDTNKVPVWILNPNGALTPKIPEDRYTLVLNTIKKYFPYFDAPVKYICDIDGLTINEIKYGDQFYATAYSTMALAQANCKKSSIVFKYISDADGKVTVLKPTDPDYLKGYPTSAEAIANKPKSNTILYIGLAAIALFLISRR